MKIHLTELRQLVTYYEIITTFAARVGFTATGIIDLSRPTPLFFTLFLCR